MPPKAANRCAGWGRVGRRAGGGTTGMREAGRAGHHAAATAVATARAIDAPMAHHGRSNRLMRRAAILSTDGADASQPDRPTTVPTTAPTAPTTAPFASITRRTWRSV